MDKKQLLEVAHVTVRGTSIRITLPKKIVKLLDVSEGDIVGFYEENGKVGLRKLE
jgi:bifunctional DNA-binding transcriptional regulator/antitoxin component of YhaV-PrlF toxin-antitoxin module